MSEANSVARLGQWTARTWSRSTASDLLYGGMVLLMASVCVWAGRSAARHLSPEAARQVSAMLDDLDVPRTLPNAVLRREDGSTIALWDRTVADRTIVTFYASWCAACQEELPKLAEGTKEHPEQLVVVVDAEDDPAEVRARLDDLGLKEMHFYVDSQSELKQGGRVTALPTTFLMGHLGRVKDRIVGFSSFRLMMLIAAAKGEGRDIDAFR